MLPRIQNQLRAAEEREIAPLPAPSREEFGPQRHDSSRCIAKKHNIPAHTLMPIEEE
jgi:hypothetical protein